MGRAVKIILISSLIFFFFFPRLSHLDKRFSYGWDQEHLSFEVKKIVKDKKLTLLGPRANNDKGFFLGPYFTYLLVPFFLATKLHPFALMWVVALYTIVFFLAGFYVLRKMRNDIFSYFFLFLWAINPLLVGYDINPWWPLLIPLGIITLWFSLYRLHNKISFINLVFVGSILGFLINLHFQNIFLILFVLLFFIINRKVRDQTRSQKFSIVIISFLIFMLPLFLFDVRHEFLNTKLFLNFFLPHSGGKPFNPFLWLPVFTNLILPFIQTKSLIFTEVFYFLLLTILVYLSKKKQGFFASFYKSLVILWILFPVLFALYQERPSEYYFLFLYPFILFAIVDFFLTAKKAFLLAAVSVVFFFANLNNIRTILTPSKTSLYYKDLTIRKLKEVTSQVHKKYNISYGVPPGGDSGYRYLVDYYGIQPSNNPSDPLIEIRIPPKNGDIVVGVHGIKIPKELRD